MPKIGRFPPFGKRFFRRARKLIGSCHFAHFWRIVMTLASLQGRRNLKRIERACRNHTTRQSIGFFLTQAQWDAPEVLRQTALATLKRLGWTSKERLYVLIDDTQKRKRAKRMDAISKIFLHAEKVYAHGHTIVSCALVYRNVVIPYAVRLWATEEFCAHTRQASYPYSPVDFHKLTELAAEMILQVRVPHAIVLFDSYYLCPVVTRACRSRNYHWVGVAKKNRNFFPDGRPRDKRKLSTYGANVLKRQGRWITAEGKKHRLAVRVGQLSKAGRVKLVFSCRIHETSWIAMATDETRWSAQTILCHYLNRWSIELLFKTSKQYLGLGDYQVLWFRGIERYLHLVLIAHLLLTHLAADEPGAKAQRDDFGPLRLPSVPQLQELLRSKLWDDMINTLETGTRNRRVGKKLKEFMQL